MDLERVKDEIRQVFGQVNKGKTPETALVAGKGKKKFKRDCRICGTKGHKAADCWENEKNKEKKATMVETKRQERR